VPLNEAQTFLARPGTKESAMKTLHLTLAAVSALAIAAPLAAQPMQGEHAANREAAPGQRLIVEDPWLDLGQQLDAAIARGAITRREALTLRTDLRSLRHLARTYGRDGFSPGERATLVRRSAGLERAIQRAEQNRERSVPRAGGKEARDKTRTGS
jgi:uncharacterized protein (DUF2252 family)